MKSTQASHRSVLQIYDSRIAPVSIARIIKLGPVRVLRLHVQFLPHCSVAASHLWSTGLLVSTGTSTTYQFDSAQQEIGDTMNATAAVNVTCSYQ